MCQLPRARQGGGHLQRREREFPKASDRHEGCKNFGMTLGRVSALIYRRRDNKPMSCLDVIYASPPRQVCSSAKMLALPLSGRARKGGRSPARSASAPRDKLIKVPPLLLSRVKEARKRHIRPPSDDAKKAVNNAPGTEYS